MNEGGRTLLHGVTKTRAFKAIAITVLGAIVLVLLFQGVRSAFRFTTSKLGYPVIAIDATPRWAATRALFFQGINPYSAEGTAVIHTAYFGRPLEASDADTVEDKQLFAYPLYVVWLYAPTVVPDFSTALVFLWIAGFLALGASVFLWFRLLDFPEQVGTRAAIAILILCIPVSYTALQTRQPALWVLFFCSAAVFLRGRGRAMTDAAAGAALAWATIKPQSSILVVGYLLLSQGLMERGNRRWIMPLSFLVSMVALWGASEWVVPGWVGDFWAGAQGYRAYAGNTGAEAALGPGPAAAISGLLFAAIWAGMIAEAIRRRAFGDGRLWAVAYAMLLQVWLFPTHSYNFLFGVPLGLLTARELVRGRGLRPEWETAILGACYAAALYMLYSQWTGILEDAGVGIAAGEIRSALPGGAAWFPPWMMALGAVAWWGGVRRRAPAIKEAAA